MPEVSVIIPTFNSARYLTAAVDSVLSQTFRDFEVLVIDDGSTDETESVMRRYGDAVRYFHQENSGVAVARNRGIAESRGRYVAFLDADDTWYAHKLERQLAALSGQSGNAAACYTAFMVVSEDLRPLAIERSKRCGSALEDLLTIGNVIGTPSTVMGERSLFQSLGGFDPKFSLGADWEMWLRLATRTEFAYVDEPLIQYRQHGTNMSRNVPLLEQDSVELLKKGFAIPELPTSLLARHRSALARNYMVLAGSYFRAHSFHNFIRCAAHALALDWRQAGYLATFPCRLLRRLRPRQALRVENADL